MLKFNGEKVKLNDELESFNNLLNFHQVYQDAPLGQGHALIREVFKDGFTYKNGVFRTPGLMKI